MSNRFSRRRFLAGTGALGAGLVFAGCSSSNGSSTGAPADGPASGEFTVWNFGSQLQTSILDGFGSAHPDLQVDLVELALPDLHERLLVSLATDTDLPDVATLSTRRVPEFIGTGGLLDLTAALEPYADDIDPAYLATSDGGTYGVSISGGHMGLWFNLEGLAAAGIDPATFTTWDGVVDAGLKLRRDSGGEQYLMVLPDGSNGFNFFNAYYHSRGGNWWTEEGELVEDQQIAVETLDWLVTQVRENQIVYRQVWTDPSFFEAIKQGNLLGFGMNYGVGTNNLPDNVPEQAGQWGLVTWPSWSPDGPKQTGAFGGVMFAGIAGGDNRPAAEEFITWWLTDEGLPIIVEALGVVPSRRAVDLGLFDSAYPYFGGQQVLKELAAVDYPPFHYHQWSKTEEVLINALDRALLGEWTPEQAVDNSLTELRSIA